MGILDAFRRKKDDDWETIGASKSTGDYGPAGLPGPSPKPMEPTLSSMSATSSDATDAIKREVDALLYKVDSLKSTLDIINQRLESIEEAIKGKGGSVY